jgi:hypothetical protein
VLDISRTKGTGVSCERGTQRTVYVEVMPSNAFNREIEPVLDSRMKPACAIDCHLPADAVSGKQHHAANRVTDSHESVQLFKYLLDDVRQASFLPKCGKMTASLTSRNSPNLEQ